MNWKNKEIKLIEVAVDIKHTTLKAALVTDCSDEDHWIPFSQIKSPEKKYITKGETITMTIPEWLAKKNNFI